MLKDFISKLPIDVIVKTEITDERVTLPTAIDALSFYKEFSKEVDDPTLTAEKAIYIASSHASASTPSYQELLNKKLVF